MITIKRFHWTLLLLFLSAFVTRAQSVEVGYVKEYNGADAKTPLPGVELNILGAPSTVSGQDGGYELHFSLMTPGDAVSYNEIYKSGYVIFNIESLKAWRISNNRTPFLIVMCNEQKFRALKAKYYDLFDKSYRREYEQAVLKMKREALENQESEQALRDKLIRLEEDYKEKLKNINTYVETFARIDHSEMSAIEAEALALIDEGKIDEGITKFEQLKVSQKADEQIAKLNAGRALVEAGQTVMESSHSDLLVLAEKLKTQIGLYEMGGVQYDAQRVQSIESLVDVYRSLRECFGSVYNQELGKWMVARDKYDLENLKEAAALPSYEGMLALGIAYEVLSHVTDSLYDKAFDCYSKAVELYPADSLAAGKVSLAAQYLMTKPAFCLNINGSDIYFRVSQDEKNAVFICSRSIVNSPSIVLFNSTLPTIVHDSRKREGTVLTLPSFVKYGGKKYTVMGIDEFSFINARGITTVSIPTTISIVGDKSFYGSDVQQCVINNPHLQRIPDVQALPKSTVFTFSKDTYKNANCYQWMTNIHDAFKEDEIKANPDAFISITEYLSKSNFSKSSWERINYYYQLALLYSDATLPTYNYDKALNNARHLMKTLDKMHAEDTDYLSAWLLMIQLFSCPDSKDPGQAQSYARKVLSLQSLPKEELLYQIGIAFHQSADYPHALPYLKEAVDSSFANACNLLAYMYAEGKGVEKDLAKAHALIDTAIALEPTDPNYYDSKGEFYLMGRDTLLARSYLTIVEDAYKEAGDIDVLNHFYESSKLYKALRQKSYREQWNSEYLNMAKEIVRAVSLLEYKRLSDINYSESVKIEDLHLFGIIAVQTLLKARTPEEMANYNVLYIAMAVRWAIENELQFRYPFISYFFSRIDDDYRDYVQAGGEGIDYSLFSVRVCLYQTALDVAQISIVRDDDDAVARWLKEQFAVWSNAVYNAIDGLPNSSDRLFIRDVLNGYGKKKGSGNDRVASLAKKYNLTWIEVYQRVNSLLDTIQVTLHSRDLVAF